MYKTTLLILFTLIINSALAQSSKKQAQKLYDEAGRFISLKDFRKAEELLSEATIVDESFINAWQQLGDVRRKLQDYKNAISAYEKVFAINASFSPMTSFALGESALNIGDYAKALNYLNKYQAAPTQDPLTKKIVEKYIKDAYFSLDAIKNPVSFNPINLGQSINSSDSEYLPMVTADEETIIYTRQKNRNEDFYKSLKKDGKWTPATFLSRNINTEAYNEGAQCISPDGMYLFFTGCNRPDGMGRCDIYICRREGKEWSKPYNIGAPVNTPGWESQPTLSADGKTLYFVSTRPGGLGGYDLYQTRLREDGSWEIPQNLGANINTPFDEISPFIHADDETLYFASNGWPGFGNKDLFVSRKDNNGNWQTPTNLGFPINTYKEESSLTVSSNGKNAFFASDKEGGFGALDIYSFELAPKLRPKVVTYVKGLVTDEATQDPLDAEIRIIHLENNRLVFDELSDSETGEFLATMPVGKKYGLNISKEGYLFHSETFLLEAPEKTTDPFNLRVQLKKLEIGGKVILKNIFFETNKFTLLEESKAELQLLIDFLVENPRVKIEIGGHTDNVGDEKTNMSLSENRAKTVHNFLVSNKIPGDRLSFKGYGESNPVASNNTESGRQANRRTEFKIVNY